MGNNDENPFWTDAGSNSCTDPGGGGGDGGGCNGTSGTGGVQGAQGFCYNGGAGGLPDPCNPGNYYGGPPIYNGLSIVPACANN